jgi:ATP-dependent helicase/nuclease subunit B
VTAFRDYLACPYLFYLRHVLRLEEIEIPGPEMDGPLFGSLAHDVLRSFGVSAARDSTSQAEIEQFLIEELERQAQRLLGAERSAALAIQLHQMRRRLRQFSAWQANHAAAGWRIDPDLAEAEARATLLAADGDHGPFLINGKIDRIDRNPATGQILLLDYKTGSTATKPDEAHRENREGVRVWIDLQLPLYLLLAGALDMDADDVSLGYVNLPKELPKVGLALAEWSAEELESAHQRAREVVVEIRNGHFWPPAEPGRRGQSGYSGICFDRYPGRGRLLREEAAR